MYSLSRESELLKLYIKGVGSLNQSKSVDSKRMWSKRKTSERSCGLVNEKEMLPHGSIYLISPHLFVVKGVDW